MIDSKLSDQSRTKFEVVAKNKDNKSRSSLWYAFDLWETGLYKRVSLVQSDFLLFVRDNSSAYEIPL